MAAHRDGEAFVVMILSYILSEPGVPSLACKFFVVIHLELEMSCNYQLHDHSVQFISRHLSSESNSNAMVSHANKNMPMSLRV
jgi:hypothetical protein